MFREHPSVQKLFPQEIMHTNGVDITDCQRAYEIISQLPYLDMRQNPDSVEGVAVVFEYDKQPFRRMVSGARDQADVDSVGVSVVNNRYTPLLQRLRRIHEHLSVERIVMNIRGNTGVMLR